MKRSELKFKCVVPNEDVAAKIKDSIIVCPNIKNQPFLRVFNGDFRTAGDASIFCSWPEPLVTYEQALEMIAQVEPEQKGEWVECELDERGFYRIVSDGIIYAKNWQDTYIAPPLIFGGWLWGRKNGKSFWSCDRFGVDSDGDTIAFVHDWVKPLTPKKIKFWRVK